MKLLKREETQSTFLIGKRERDLLLGLLRRYPIVTTAHFCKRHPLKSEETRKNQDLLQDALAEQQRENRHQLEKMLNQPGRFTENELGFALTLSETEIEWLLQVLNDIRLGSWIELGEPDTNTGLAVELSEKNVQLAWAIEMAGLFQHALLEAAPPVD